MPSHSEAEGFAPDQYVEEFSRSAGLEMLEPTRMYVRPVWKMITEGLPLHGLYHITGDGLLNLTRGDAPLGFDIEWLPKPQPVFRVIQRCGEVSAAEMYRVFNMGVGFCIVAPESAFDRVRDIAAEYDIEAWKLGAVLHDEQKRVWLRMHDLVGEGEEFQSLT